MKISVIIPCFNNADHIEETLSSVQNQTFPDWECMIVDDGSTDNSKAIINSFCQSDGRFRYLERPADLLKGANSCRNYGVKECSGTHIIFLDADDLLSTDCLEIRNSAKRDEDLLVFSTAHFTESIKEATPFISGLNLNLSPINYRDMFLGYWIPWHISSGLWERSFFEKIGGFDISQQRFQDVELHARALSTPILKFKIDFSHGYSSYYRKSSFHTKIGLEKRRFILDQGFLYAKKLKSLLKPQDFIKSEGLFIYLLFRFEEVFTPADVKEVKRLFQTDAEENGKSYLKGDLAVMVTIFDKVLSVPNRFRKYLSYIIYRKFRFTQSKRLNS
ncbi:glycosyltransferase family 2 protein [Algoriphagus yeomjeoni]|uniref:Glycosyltransferase involved in cell wall biosynthesis n=1 Tax=Algoriphagus yeomjeoni TaxID=291403 RepID=A0A327PB88_9BACT|nr:glycosyltransferase family 2 protein [Algoriphagus yeomjeoni]RAI89508.1 glycosyltransferase involved in cell wall biosynthesis [Algoriphagus yeomjeoni]